MTILIMIIDHGFFLDGFSRHRQGELDAALGIGWRGESCNFQGIQGPAGIAFAGAR